jgi:hypothetical protein
MWGYRKPRQYSSGLDLAKMLNCLVFFLLMALISSAGIPTLLMSNRQAIARANVSHIHIQFAKSHTIQKARETQTADFKSKKRAFNNHGKPTVVASNIQTVAYRP